MLKIDEQKTALNARVKAEMDLYLRSKTWVEKVESIERMNEMDKIAKESMRVALARKRVQTLAVMNSESESVVQDQAPLGLS